MLLRTQNGVADGVADGAADGVADKAATSGYRSIIPLLDHLRLIVDTLVSL
jgi:hypothetical protein